jgi:hypothetical protein
MSILLAVEMDTHGKFMLLVVGGDTPCTSILLAAETEMDKPCTCILLAVEGKTQGAGTSILLAVESNTP